MQRPSNHDLLREQVVNLIQIIDIAKEEHETLNEELRKAREEIKSLKEAKNSPKK